jgi:hypothetical protein
MRNFLENNAPQISESGHDQLIGWLDGAQTNHLRVDIPPSGYYGWAVWAIKCKDSERIPWFDTAHHSKFVLHGAGYESRYSAGLDTRLHGIYSDDYICTEFLQVILLWFMHLLTGMLSANTGYYTILCKHLN